MEVVPAVTTAVAEGTAAVPELTEAVPEVIKAVPLVTAVVPILTEAVPAVRPLSFIVRLRAPFRRCLYFSMAILIIDGVKGLQRIINEVFQNFPPACVCVCVCVCYI